MKKSRKGKMPAALAKYWATHKRGKKRAKKSVRDPAHKKIIRKLRSHFASDEAAMRRRAPNPKPKRGYKLVIVQGKTRLHDSGGAFTTSAPPVVYPTADAVKRAAQAYSQRYRKLRKFAFIAVPV